MTPPSPVVRTRSQHSISRRDIDPDALKVLYRLARRGQVAYLVGGSVRDLLLGRKPKDFDVSTDARPRQLKSIFPNCFLIGRRFRLAHIRYGEKIIETSTFRRQPETEEDPESPEASLLQQDDNTFGSPEEDARRRDFTINGLFYDAEKSAVIDYVGGLDDLQAGVVRCIGDPDIRFREDPVRMIRAIRFASRLGFAIEAETQAAIERHRAEIDKAAPPRLVEEIQRLFAFGAAEPAFRLLHETGFMQILLPELEAHIDATGPDCRLWRLLRALDQGGSVLEETTPPLRLTALFADYADARPQEKTGEGAGRHDLAQHVRQVLSPTQERLKLPRRIFDRMIRILAAQPRFEPGSRRRRGRSRFVRQGSFPESLAFREMALQADEADEEAWEEWRSWLELYRERQANLAEQDEEDEDGAEGDESSGGSGSASRKRGRRGRRGRRGGRGSRSRSRGKSSGSSGGDDAGAEDAPAKDEKPRKKSRRRRGKKSSGSDSGDAGASGTSSESGDPKETSGTETTDGASSGKSPKRKRRRRKKNGSTSDGGGSKSRRSDRSGTSPDTSADSVDTSQPVTAMSFYGGTESSGEESPSGGSDNGKRGGKASSRDRGGRPGSDDPKSGSTDNARKPHKPAPDETAPLWMEEI
jgi:poly(A) polymerase